MNARWRSARRGERGVSVEWEAAPRRIPPRARRIASIRPRCDVEPHPQWRGETELRHTLHDIARFTLAIAGCTMLHASRDASRICAARRRSKSEIRQARMIVGPAAERPVEQAVRFADRHVVDARMTMRHQAVLVELPVLVAIRAEPVARVVAPLVREAHRDPVAGKRPQFLDQPIVDFARPLAAQQRDDLRAARREFRAIAPFALRRVGKRNALGVARVPSIFSSPNFLNRGFPRERWNGWADFG
nr:hypothetical protein X990_5421 [Burkholderia pseudomallei MSHR4868]